MTMVTSLVNKVVTSLVNMIMMTYLVNELVLFDVCSCLMSFKVTSLVSILLVTLLQMLGMVLRRSLWSRLVSGRRSSSALGAFSSC